MDASNLLKALEVLADEHSMDIDDFAAPLAEGLYDEILRFAGTPDAYVALDLDSGEMTLQALPESGTPVNISLNDLGRRGAALIKEVLERAVYTAKIERLELLLEETTGTLVFGTVRRASAEVAIVELPDEVDGELRSIDAPGVNLKGLASRAQGSRIAAVITGDVEVSGGTPRAKLSRKDPQFITLLLERAVPSIADGAIKLLTTAREPGIRTKLLISQDSKFNDPVALIIGTRGSTIRQVTDEISPERIDVIMEGTLDEMVTDALLPAKVLRVEHTENHSVAWVDADQRAMALGRNGTNVRLASQLLGRRIDVRTVETANESPSESVTQSPTQNSSPSV